MATRTANPLFRRIGFGAVLAVIGVCAWYATVRQKSRAPEVRVTGSSDNPFADYKPAKATSTPTPGAAPTPPVIQHYQRPYAASYQQHQESEAERRRRAAYLSQIAIKGPNDNVTELASRESPAKPISLKPAPPHSIFPGTFIRGILRTAINSDLPGPVEAEVSQDVRDSGSLTEILIPHGTQIIGEYSNKLVLTQNRLLVSWTKLVFPDGAELAIPKWSGQDASGANGFADQVDNHALKIWGPSILMSAIAAATAYATVPSYNNYGPNSSYNYGQQQAQQEAMSAGIYGLSSRAQQQLNRKLNGIQPTITIREGYPIVVMVQSRWTFDGGYHE
jgi:type IV secretory pathway VirB10-like protein